MSSLLLRRSRRREVARGFAVLAALFTALLGGGGLMAPPGVGVACGCSGGPGEPYESEPGWSYIRIDHPGSELATNGVLMVWGDVLGVPAEALPASIEVTVTTAAGDPVDGTLEFVDDGILAWRPANELPPSENLVARAEVLAEYQSSALEAQTIELVTAAGPLGPIVPPAIEVSITRSEVPVGPTESCTIYVNGTCDGEARVTRRFEIESEIRDSLRASWVSDVNATTAHPLAYELVITPEPSSPWPPSTFYRRTYRGTVRDLQGSAHVNFDGVNSEYCVSLAGRSIATGETFETVPVCESDPVSFQEYDLDAVLERCIEPPTGDLLARWCALKPGECEPDEDAGTDAGGDAGAARADPGEGGDSQPSSTASGAPNGETEETGGCSCRVGDSAGSTPAEWLAGFVAFAVAVGAWGRRRRST